MGFGLEVYGADGREQISSAKSAFALGVVRRQTVSATGVFPFANPQVARYFDITYDGECPMVALIIPPPLSGGVLTATRSGTIWTIRVMICADTASSNPGDATSPFTYVLLDRVKPEIATFGLNVFGELGSLLFSSKTKTLEVIGGPGSVLPNSNLAVVYSGSLRVETETVTDEGAGLIYTDWRLYFAGATRNGNKIDFRENIIGADRVEGGSGGPTPGTGLNGWGAFSDLLVIDPTNYQV